MSIPKVLRERNETMNVVELAKLLRVSAATVQRWGRQRLIPTIRVGDTIRFDPGMLADWVELRAACTHQLLDPGEPPSEHQLGWQEMGELAPEEFLSVPKRSRDDGAH
ncbi:MAG: helix-turn-helix domain-containing protein [Candidatus Sulfotelmatobacter sp.]|jgi:excisionase family DNA binding protein